MAKKLWRVDGPLKLWDSDPGTQAYQYAVVGEVLEEVTMPGTTGSPDDVRMFRTKEVRAIRSYIVSRSELTANAKSIPE
jgi:hypothetical protein